MTYDEAVALPADERIAGIVVEGNAPPFGGSWTSKEGSLTLTESPTGSGTAEETKEKEDA